MPHTTSCMLLCPLTCAYKLSEDLGSLCSFLPLASELPSLLSREGLECTRLLKATTKWSKDMQGKKGRFALLEAELHLF